jgi:transcriptional regulatory protein RtcR
LKLRCGPGYFESLFNPAQTLKTRIDFIFLNTNWQIVQLIANTNVLTNIDEIALDAHERMNLIFLREHRRSRFIADAGRALFGASRAKRNSINDSDRLRKFLQRFGLNWDAVTSGV